jgi:hypothetical protein
VQPPVGIGIGYPTGDERLTGRFVVDLLRTTTAVLAPWVMPQESPAALGPVG